MNWLDRKHKGARNELIATVWLLNQGYEVFRNVSHHGPVDIIAMNPYDKEIILIDVKSAQFYIKDGERVIIYHRAGNELGIKYISVSDDGDCWWNDEQIDKREKLKSRKEERSSYVRKKNLK